MWPLGKGGANEALLPVLSSLMLTLTPSPRLWALLSFLFLLLLGLTFALGVWLSWREGPSPWRTPQACALVASHR